MHTSAASQEAVQKLVTTLLQSLPMLFDVLLLCGFAFFIFGIVGIQLFSGALRYRYPPYLSKHGDGLSGVAVHQSF